MQSAPVALAAAAPQDAAAAVSVAGPDAAAPPARMPISRPELIRLLLEPRLASMTPEQVQERLAVLGLARTEPLPDSLELIAGTPRELVKLGYIRDASGRWGFVHVRVDLVAATPAEAGATYEELAALVRKKLGKPQWIKEQPPYLARSFKLGAQLEVNVGAVTSADEGRPYAALTIVTPQRP